MTLYLKYRPRNLGELDIKSVADSLKKIVTSKNIPHAFLFAGPKGTGKTSAARILAKVVNCENLAKDGDPCDKCEQCLSVVKGNNIDVIEMDAASNRGIDDIRNLKDAIKLSPANAKKKVYIIDEAHMLTTEASNALLKTLEEPPSHVIIILATTNPEKLIDTIRSRATLIQFRKATTDEILNSLKRIVEGEKFKIKDDVLEKIAIRAGGAFRDAVKLLEQVSIEGAEILESGSSGLEVILEDLYRKERNKCIDYIKKSVDLGVDLEVLVKELLQRIQKDIIEGRVDLVPLAELIIEANSQAKDSPIEELPIIIAITKWCGGGDSGAQNLEFNERVEAKVIVEMPEDVIKAEDPNVSTEENFDNEEAWKKILAQVKPINASMEALLRSSKPLNYDGNTLTLGVYYKFHKERLEESSHRKILEQVVTNILNSETRVACTLMEAPLNAPLTDDKDKDIIRVAEEIF